MPKRSAGLLLHRPAPDGRLEVLLVHPGGPLWARRDDGAWTLPKGEYGAGEDPLEVAEREFAEELGQRPPDGVRVDLGELRQAGGKLTRCWAVAGEVDVAVVTSNTFDLEWPPRSGRIQAFPEIDRAEWMALADARRKLLASLVPFLDRLVAATADAGEPG
jgi:predicted NUDIX family NTP pyrophosphohydrolase